MTSENAHMRACKKTKVYLLHVSREFCLVKLICRNLYALFPHVRKAYTANQNGVQLFSHVEV